MNIPGNETNVPYKCNPRSSLQEHLDRVMQNGCKNSSLVRTTSAPVIDKGNYRGYYKTRMNSCDRLGALSKDWFKGKTCLDIGCNDGQFSLAIAENFEPLLILGIDPDFVLIDSAKSRLKRLLYELKQHTSSAAEFSASANVPEVAPTFIPRITSFVPRALAIAKRPSVPKVQVVHSPNSVPPTTSTIPMDV
jgi:SAM-dependent methyltransferase